MIHKDRGLVIYVDCQPSEQVDGKNNNSTACLIGLSCLNPEPFSKYKQYKSIASSDRPTIAQEIANDIEFSDNVYCFGSHANISSIKTIGEKFISKIIDEITEGVIKKKSRTFRVLKREINHKSALFAPWYGLSLVLMCLPFARIAAELNQKKVTFSLDCLPGDPKGIMQLISIINSYPTTFKYIKKIEERYNLSIEVANMTNYIDSRGERKDARFHPGMVLVDWIVHSAYCAMNDLPNIDDGNRDELYKELITKPFEVLQEKDSISLIPFAGLVFTSQDDPDYTDELKKQLDNVDMINVFDDNKESDL